MLGLEKPTPAEVREIATGSMLSPSVRRFPQALTGEALEAAIQTVEKLGQRATTATTSGH
jgi:hypothetical protein